MSKELSDAIKDNKPQLVQQLITNGVDVNTKNINSFDVTVLGQACYHLNIEIVKLLLSAGADVNTIYQENRTALAEVCASYQKPREKVRALVSLLLEHGAAPSLTKEKVDGPLHYACMYGYSEAVDLLIEAGADVNQKGSYGRTPVIYAAITINNNGLSMLKTLLQAGADIQAKNDADDNALFEMIMRTDEKEGVAQFLIQNGIDWNDNFNKDSALHYAAFHGRQKIIDILLKEGVNINLPNKQGKTALQNAISKYNLDLVKYLHEQGADILLKDYYTTVLEFAVEKEDEKFVLKLLKELGEASKGQGALEKAAEKGNLQLAKILIKAGIPIDDRRHSTSDTALMKAAYYGQEKMLDFLLKKGADYKLYNYKGNTALLQAAWKGKGVERLLEAGADINQRNDQNWNALMQACQQNNLELVQFLLERGSPIDVVDKEYGATALIIAQDAEASKIVKLLKSYKATTRLIKKEKCTILECDICAYLEEKKDVLPKENFIKKLHLKIIADTETRIEKEIASCVYIDSKENLYHCPNCKTIYYNKYELLTQEFHIISTNITNTLLRVNLLRSRDLLVHWNKTAELAIFDKSYPKLIQLFQTKISQDSETIKPQFFIFVLEAVLDSYLETNNWKDLENNLLKNNNYKVVLLTIESYLLICKEKQYDTGVYPILRNYKVVTLERFERYKIFLETYFDQVLAYLTVYKNHENKEINKLYEATNRTADSAIKAKKVK